MSLGNIVKWSSLPWIALICLSGPVSATTPPYHYVDSESSSLEIIPRASIIMPSSLVLRTADFDIPYSETFSGGVPSFSLGVAVPYADWGQLQFSWLVTAGYGRKEGVFDAGTRSRHSILLHWMPVTAGTRILYNIPGAAFVSPTLIVGGGAFWIRQRASLDPLNASFLIPFAFISPGLTFFEGRNLNDWFGGLTFGTSIFRSVATSGETHGMSFDMSVSILL